MPNMEPIIKLTDMELYPSHAGIARTVRLLDKDLYNHVIEKIRPLSNDLNLIPLIYKRIEVSYPQLDRTDFNILFVCTVYRVFSPSHFIGDNLERCPNGIRKIVCELMKWKDLPTVNYYLGISTAYYKGKAYKQKVHSLIECLGLIINQ